MDNLFFLLVCVLFSAVYAKIEFGLDNWWVELGKDPGGFWTNKYGKYTPYHLWMLGLDAIVNLPTLYVAKSVPLFLACLLAFPFLEDVFYFMWRGKWVQEHEWTVKDFGFWKIRGAVIPKWYAYISVAIAALLLLA